MALTPITERDLRRLAHDDDAELRVGPGQGGDAQVAVVEGSWGKRLVRNLSSLFRDADKAEQYGAAKKAVLESLTSMYGADLATRVFRANIGRIRDDGAHVSSAYHPITGRHIRKMMDQADRAMVRKYADPEMGGIKLGRATSGTNAPQATLNWMTEKLGGAPDHPRVSVELRGSRLDIADSPGRDRFGQVAETLWRDAEARLGEQPLLWTLDVGIGDQDRFFAKHPIGLCIDPQDPGRVQVFDGNVRAVTVPREDFAAWLAGHVTSEYALDRIELHRAGPLLDGYFEEVGGRLGQSSGRIAKTPKEVGDWLGENISVMKKVPQELPRLQPDIERLPTCEQFNRDVDRENFQVALGGRDFILRSQNAPELLASLVEGGTPDETRNAVLNLSILLNQNLSNTASDMIANDRKTHIQERPNGNIREGDEDYCGIVPQGIAGKSVAVSRRGDDIHIELEMTQPLSFIGLPDQRQLDPDASWLKTGLSIDISLEALRTEGGYELCRTSRLVGETRMTLPLDEDPGVKNRISMFGAGERFVSDRLVSLDDTETVLRASVPYDGPPIDGEVPEELTDTGSANLARLLAPRTAIGLCDGLVATLTKGGPPLEDHQGMQTTFVQVTGPDGQKAVDIVFRHPIPDHLPGLTAFYGSDPPSAEGSLETVVSIRVPLAQLNEGLPETFDFLHGPRLEWTPR